MRRADSPRSLLAPGQRQILEDFFPDGAVVIDLETTGLSPLADRIVEVAMIEFTPGHSERIFETLINPKIPIPPASQAIHQITDTMVKAAPSAEEVAAAMARFIGERPLIAHNAAFDAGFLIGLFRGLDLPLPDSDVYCTLRLSRATIPKLGGHGLESLADFFGVDLGTHHRAHGDALCCLEILTKLLSELQTRDLPSLLKQKAYLFRLGDFEETEPFALPARLEGLHELIEKQEIIEIIYDGGSQKKRPRPIQPIGFLPSAQGPILHAKCLRSGVYKSFAVRKIMGHRNYGPEERRALEEKMAEMDRLHKKERAKMARR